MSFHLLSRAMRLRVDRPHPTFRFGGTRPREWSLADLTFTGTARLTLAAHDASAVLPFLPAC
jgi:hypothetical protein